MNTFAASSAARSPIPEQRRSGDGWPTVSRRGMCFGSSRPRPQYSSNTPLWRRPGSPIEGDNYLYLYCLWVDSAHKGQGYGRALMEHCLADARARGRSGACMLGAEKQKSWSSDQSFAGRYGFRAVDATPQGYRLLAHAFDGTVPRFAESAKRGTIEEERLTIYYDAQCPYVWQSLQTVRKYCEAQGVPFVLIEVDTLEEAKALPCVFNDYAVFYHGRFETVNLLDTAYLKRILKK